MHPRSLRSVAVVALLSSWPCGGAAAAEPIRAGSHIESVTVYADRAIVTRTARVDLATGTQDIHFPGLPDALDANLLHATATGDAQVTILEVRAVSAQVEAPANERLKELEEQLRTAKNELRVFDDRTSTLQLERDFLERIKTAATTPASEDGVSTLPGLAQWEQLLTFYTSGLARVATAMQEIDREKERVQARIEAINRAIAELSPQQARAVKDVFVRVDVSAAGGLDVGLTYTVRGASWQPTYDARVHSAENKLSLGYSAMVSQSTGEDWTGVKLTLSTARPAIGGTPPELSPWYVREEQPIVFEDRARGAAAPAAAAMEADKAVMHRFAKATVETGLMSATFHVSHPTDVPADNAPHKVPITVHELDTELTHLAIPKQAELAYLRAAVQNTSEYPLIAGPLNIFVDGTFVARAGLRTVMPREKFDLDLGVDDAVAIKRQLRNRLTEETGLVSSKERITYDVLITAQNNRANAIKLLVKDQVPVSQHERITVELLEPPSRTIARDQDGTLTWTLDLAPGDKRELPLKFSVQYPADMPIGGLE